MKCALCHTVLLDCDWLIALGFLKFSLILQMYLSVLECVCVCSCESVCVCVYSSKWVRGGTRDLFSSTGSVTQLPVKPNTLKVYIHADSVLCTNMHKNEQILKFSLSSSWPAHISAAVPDALREIAHSLQALLCERPPYLTPSKFAPCCACRLCCLHSLCPLVSIQRQCTDCWIIKKNPFRHLKGGRK